MSSADIDDTADTADKLSLFEKLYEQRLNIIGKRLKKSSCIIKNILIDGRRNKDTIIYNGEIDGKPVIVKYAYDGNNDGVLQNSVRTMDHLKELGIPMYFYQLDSLEADTDVDSDSYDETNVFLIIEKLYKITKNDVFMMLVQLINNIFKYQHYMTHCDIKPDNILCSMPNVNGEKTFYLIDYDDTCNEKLLYGYKRTTFTPQFTSQTSNSWPVVTTIKHDIIELILSAHAIYYKDDLREDPKFSKSGNMWYLVWQNDRATRRRIFGPLYIYALTMDERNVTSNDHVMLLNILTLTLKNDYDALDIILSKLNTQTYT